MYSEYVTSSMERRLRHSVAADPRERAETNALLEATDQEDAPRVELYRSSYRLYCTLRERSTFEFIISKGEESFMMQRTS